MEASDLDQLEGRLGPLPSDYREFLSSYPESFRHPIMGESLSALVHDDLQRLLHLNETGWTSGFRARGFIVIGGNGVGDPYLIKRDGEPGVFIGNHETGELGVVQEESDLARFLASFEAKRLDRFRDLCVARGDLEDALRLADAAVGAWKRYGRGKQATEASRARTSLRLLTDPKKNDAELGRILAADPPKAAAALGTAANVAPGLVDAILDAKMFPRYRTVAYANLWRALPKRELVTWAMRRGALRKSPGELFWLDWSLQRAGIDRATRDELFASLPVPPAALFDALQTGDGLMSAWVDLPIEVGVPYPFGDDDHLSYQERTTIAFAAPLRMTRTPITELQYVPFRNAFLEPLVRGRELDPREPACVGFGDAIAYGRWLEVKGGLAGVRLPTEEEWEVACRAGTWWSAAAPDDLDEIAWPTPGSGKPICVARKSANPWGLYDMVGLEAEWTLGEYDGSRMAPAPRVPPRTVDPAAVAPLPTNRPDYPMVCGGRPSSSGHDPALRSGRSLESVTAFRLVAPCRS